MVGVRSHSAQCTPAQSRSCFSLKLVSVVGWRESDELLLLLISSLDPADPSCDSQRERAQAGLATRRRLLGLGRVGVDSASRPPALSLRPTLVHLGSPSCRCRCHSTRSTHRPALGLRSSSSRQFYRHHDHHPASTGRVGRPRPRRQSRTRGDQRHLCLVPRLGPHRLAHLCQPRPADPQKVPRLCLFEESPLARLYRLRRAPAPRQAPHG